MRRIRRGITLTETITALVAAALLIATVVPALADARRRGKDVVCLRNLGRVAQASLVYSARDPQEQCIPVVFPNATGTLARYPRHVWGGKSGLGNFGEVTSAVYGPSFRMNANHRSLNHIIYRQPIPDTRPGPGPNGVFWAHDFQLDFPVFRCPSDVGYTGANLDQFWPDSDMTAYDFFGNSYACMTGSLVLIPGGAQSFVPYLHPLSRIVSPAQTISYLEANGDDASSAESADDPPCASTVAGDARGWHGTLWTFNTAFFDGHVAPKVIRGYRNVNLGHVPLGFDSDMLRCLVRRGPDWQIDAFPAPPVPIQ